jgi:hypothetical protein
MIQSKTRRESWSRADTKTLKDVYILLYESFNLAVTNKKYCLNRFIGLFLLLQGKSNEQNYPHAYNRVKKKIQNLRKMVLAAHNSAKSSENTNRAKVVQSSHMELKAPGQEFLAPTERRADSPGRLMVNQHHLHSCEPPKLAASDQSSTGEPKIPHLITKYVNEVSLEDSKQPSSTTSVALQPNQQTEAEQSLFTNEEEASFIPGALANPDREPSDLFESLGKRAWSSSNDTNDRHLSDTCDQRESQQEHSGSPQDQNCSNQTVGVHEMNLILQKFQIKKSNTNFKLKDLNYEHN